MKKKIFGYVGNESYNFIGEMKKQLYNRDHLNASKSMIIELALMELMENNNILSIERKLLNKKML